MFLEMIAEMLMTRKSKNKIILPRVIFGNRILISFAKISVPPVVAPLIKIRAREIPDNTPPESETIIESPLYAGKKLNRSRHIESMVVTTKDFMIKEPPIFFHDKTKRGILIMNVTTPVFRKGKILLIIIAIPIKPP